MYNLCGNEHNLSYPDPVAPELLVAAHGTHLVLSAPFVPLTDLSSTRTTPNGLRFTVVCVYLRLDPQVIAARKRISVVG